ncbi:SMP-30/gluconolactonase/LRE family protein [Pseudorhodobacter sp. W20_MBD10_FR17]|uniref:SMP-30/gluconolactonase/LRE family protein n=1 Tax=Pseudorhodobacter sp. W20_MBD10_FR17 TaxID=3240266 RepID=UPI003F99D4BC
MTPAVFDTTPCVLGEGPLWLPDRNALIWFDILNRTMFMRGLQGPVRQWAFDGYVSAAGRVSGDRLLIASQTALSLFDLKTGAQEVLAPLEADNPITRSNDGRADPYGGFWIGTMGIKAEPKAGAIWRYYKGELRKIFAGITISNAICFTPDGGFACFCDTKEGVIRRVRLNVQGWPVGAPEVFIDLRTEGLNPDGAVMDAEGALWSAQWGASRVARYDGAGRFTDAVAFPVAQISCPAFGGPDLTTLYATSAAEGIAKPSALDGAVFAAEGITRGQQEHLVIL